MKAMTALRGAVHAALAGSPGLAPLVPPGMIFDAAPHGTRPPYVLFTRLTSSPLEGLDGGGEEHGLDLAFWSQGQGRREAEAMAAAAIDALRGSLALPAPLCLVNLEALGTETVRDPATGWFRCLLRLRAVTEDGAQQP